MRTINNNNNNNGNSLIDCNVEGVYVSVDIEPSTNETTSSEPIQRDFGGCRRFLYSDLLWRPLLFSMASCYVFFVILFAPGLDSLTGKEYIFTWFLYGGIVLYTLNWIDFYKRVISPIVEKVLDIFQETKYRDITTGCVTSGILGFIAYRCLIGTSGYVERFFAFCSMLAIITVCALIGFGRSRVYLMPWSIVLRSLNLHFLLAITFTYTTYGSDFISYIGEGIVEYLGFSSVGAAFVYGERLIDEYIFAFYILPTIYLSLFTIAILKHVGFIKYMLMFSQKMAFAVGITPIEGVFGITNSFLSMTETVSMIGGTNLEKLNTSEMFGLLVTGLSTISFSALFGYVSLGADMKYLVTSSIISIPCGFGLAKLVVPPTQPRGNIRRAHNHPVRSPSSEEQLSQLVLDAAANDNTSLLDRCIASIAESTQIVQAIIGNLIAIMSFVSVTDKIIQQIFRPFVADVGLFSICNKCLSYVVLAFGVDAKNAKTVAEMLVNKILINEFAAYNVYGQRLDEFTSERSRAVANLIVCGFGNVSAAGMLISMICSLSQMRMNPSKYLTKALFIACLVNVYCACVVAILVDD